jgi:hypothetical protein
LQENLNSRIGGIMAFQEQEFLRAYRGHIYAVQKDLVALKAAASTAALTLARDAKVKEVEVARDWYREEALRLSKLSTLQTAELEDLRARLSATAEDAAWLGERARAAARTEARLGAELEAARGVAAAAVAGEEGGSGGGGATAVPTFGAAVLGALSPLRRRELLAKTGGAGAGVAEGGGAAATGAAVVEVEALRSEVAALRAALAEERSRREAIEAAGCGGGGGGGAAGEGVEVFGADEEALAFAKSAAAALAASHVPSRVTGAASAAKSAAAAAAAARRAAAPAEPLPPGLRASKLPR